MNTPKSPSASKTSANLCATCLPLFASTLAIILSACSSSSAPSAAASAPAPAPVVAMPAPAVAAPTPVVSAPAPTPIPTSAPQATVVAASIDFDKQVKPFFEMYCNKCHATARPSGRVQLGTQAGLKAAATRVGGAISSNMPPNGNPKPTAAEIATIKQWITEGAKISDSFPTAVPAATPAAAPTPRPGA